MRCKSWGVVVCGVVFLCAAGFAAEGREAEPMPPPEELLQEMEGFTLPHEAIAPPAELTLDTREALSPMRSITGPDGTVQARPLSGYGTQAEYFAALGVPPPPPPVEYVPRSAAPAQPAQEPKIVMSPPSAVMPAEYFDFPLTEAGIPGVVLPEIDYGWTEPGQDRATRRPRMRGLSRRQLEPLFALAKGSEGEALAARARGDSAVADEQLRAAVETYTDIVLSADAAHEAREEAWYGVARCEYRLGNWWRAFEALERSFPEQYEQAEVASRIKLEMFIGERLWRMEGTPVPDAWANGKQLNGWQAAARVYDAAVFNQPTGTDAPVALLRRGDAAALEQNWAEAARLYRQTVEYFPETEQAMQARSSLSEVILYQEKQYGVRTEAWQDMGRLMDDVERARGSLSPEAAERRGRAVRVANNEIAETKLRHAKEYLGSLRMRKSRDAAVWLLGDIVSNYPDTEQAEEARELLLDMGIEPPMRISDGDRFPVSSGWSVRDGEEEQTPVAPAGTVEVGRQSSDR